MNHSQSKEDIKVVLFNQAQLAYEKKDYKKAAEFYKSAADRGLAQAQYQLAKMYAAAV